MKNTRVGAFELDRLVGEGGMASVWSAHHVESDLLVAVKLVQRMSDRMRAVFRREVEAVAGLDHPGIVMVYDHGERDHEPWLVMEHASGGSLEGAPLPDSWSAMLERVLRILDALAHAHARGVVHRDLKPGNVLVCTAGDLRPGLKLADFGLALALDGRQVLAAGAGTPAYMAPEQVLGHWWNLGPWTDLYALGGMAWEMATGTRPFPGDDPKVVGRAQVNTPLPVFEPQIPVPSELEDWLRALLEKDPSKRPESAAWCAAELLAMGPAEKLSGAKRTPIAGALPTMGLYTLVPGTAITEELDDLPSLTALDQRVVRTPLNTSPNSPVAPTRYRLDPPADWHRATSMRPSGLTAGLGLFGVRPTPFEGRRTERHRLWNLLRVVSRLRFPHVGLIRGTQGQGASRLAQWLGQRGAEVGASKLLTVAHGASGDALQGIPALAEQVIRLRGVPPEIAQQRADALGVLPQQLLALSRGEDVANLADVALRLVMHEAQAGPVVLWLDDAHLDEGAFKLIKAILDAGAVRELPVLVLATVDDDAVDAQPSVARAIERLQARDQVQIFPLQPLKRGAMNRLLKRLLPLDPKVIPQVAEMANGSPLVAAQLLGSWLADGDLIPTRDGFAPARGAAAPQDLRQVWEGRLKPFLDRWIRSERHAVLVAAVLGATVDRKEWLAACELLLVPPAEDAVAELARAGLVRTERRGFRFAHGLIREVLLSSSETEGVRAEFEAACAQVVPPEAAERVGRHLMHSGKPLQAYDKLTLAIETRMDLDNYGAAMWLVDQAETCLNTAAIPEGDVRRGQVMQMRIHNWVSDWQLERCLTEGATFLTICDQYGWTEDGKKVLFYMGNAAFRLVRLEQAEVIFSRLLEMTEPETSKRARALRGLGQVCQSRREYAKAEVYYKAYNAIALKDGDPFLIASSYNDLGSTATRLGRKDDALMLFKKGLDICIKHNFKDRTVARLNVLGQLLGRGQYKEAHEQAMICLAEAEEQFFSVFALAATTTLLLQTTAATQDWATWELYQPRVRTLLEAAKLRDHSIGESCVLAAEHCVTAGKTEHARFAYNLALEQFQALGQTDDVADVRAELAKLDG